jgi:hypothetical protein
MPINFQNFVAPYQTELFSSNVEGFSGLSFVSNNVFVDSSGTLRLATQHAGYGARTGTSAAVVENPYGNTTYINNGPQGSWFSSGLWTAVKQARLLFLCHAIGQGSGTGSLTSYFQGSVSLIVNGVNNYNMITWASTDSWETGFGMGIINVVAGDVIKVAHLGSYGSWGDNHNGFTLIEI